MTPKLTRITKRGQSYLVEGVVDGEKAGFSIHAKDVEELSRADFEALCLRNLPECVESKRYEVTV